MAKLLRLHLSCVGHKDARFFPLKLDFRNRQGAPTDTVIWLMNGGGKSSLMNLFYSIFLPESRKFLGSKAESRERKLADYVKGSDVAVVLSEWEMSAGSSVFSATRIVGQVLAWKGGIATPDEEARLDREFFTFRGSKNLPFEELPFHGLHPQPKVTLPKIREWLGEIGGAYPQLELERGDQSSKSKWREMLDRVGIDTELFNYHLKMNMREGGAAELFKVKDTMQFVDLFLEMALNPEHADKTREQIEAVREKLLRLPQKECEERFTVALLGEFRPLAHEAAEAFAAEAALREKRQSNFLLRSAIEASIATATAHRAAIDGTLMQLRSDRADAVTERKSHQEYRLNYNNLVRELTFQEAKSAVEKAKVELDLAAQVKNLAAAGIRFARICSRQRELDELVKAREAELLSEKPVLDELHTLGATYWASVDVELQRVNEALGLACVALKAEELQHVSAQNLFTELNKSQSQANAELKNIRQRLSDRDKRREILRKEKILDSEEKASDALNRWKVELDRVTSEISLAEARVEQIGELLESKRADIEGLENQVRTLRQQADQKDEMWKRGDAEACTLKTRVPIKEVLATDSPDLNFPDLLLLLQRRQQQLEEEFIRGRVDRVDDERTIHSVEVERLFPPTREVEIVLAFLRDRGLKTALPAYRFLATNAALGGTARRWLTNDPGRFSGVIVTSEEEFATLHENTFVVQGLRHPVQVTLSEIPPTSTTIPTTVALPQNDGAFHYESAATGRSEVESRLEKSSERLAEIARRKQETVDVALGLKSWRDEFGAGRLEAFAAERDQFSTEGDRVDAQVNLLRTQVSVLLSERSDKGDELRKLRPAIMMLTKGQERLIGYIEEYEDNAEQWLEERRNKIELVEELGGKIEAQQREVDRLAGEVRVRAERVRSLESESGRLGEEQNAIRFHKGTASDGPVHVEAIKTRYQTAIARYEDRFGSSKLEGQIEQAGSNLKDLREEHRLLSRSLLPVDIEMAAKQLDLIGQQEEADRRHLKAHAEHETAVQQLAVAEQDRPDVPAHKQGLGLPPGEPRPKTATEAKARRDALDKLLEENNTRLESLDSAIAANESERASYQGTIDASGPHLTTLEDLIEASGGVMPALPTSNDALNQLVTDAKRQTKGMADKHKAASDTVDERIEDLRKVTRHEEFSPIPAVARERLGSLQREELTQRCNEFIQSHEAWQKVLRDEIETLGKDKDIVVRALDGVATSAVRLLAKADRASIMPDAFPGWTGQAFLKITAQPIIEPAARRDRLAELVTRLVAEKAIPTGHELASRALREIGGQIRATLLKPEDPLRPDRHDITEFGGFSGGEKMTAAILLYVTLAQLRMRGRDEQSREREAGVLLLDNPFGTASKREFVELQLRVARQMGVQLIYTTGVNDLGALDVLPRILRLRKRHRDRKSGDLLLSQEPPEEHVEGVQASLRL